MRVGIIGNMKQEMKNLKERMSNIGVKTIMGFCYYIGDIDHVTIVLINSPVGKVNVSIATSLLISSFELDMIINFGSIIPLDATLKYGDVVIANQTCEWDINNSAIGYDRGYIFGLNQKKLTCNEHIATKLYEIAKNGNHIEYGIIATADTFVTQKADKELIKEEFQAVGADMESASIHHVCEYARVSFGSIKVVYDELTLENYQEFTKMAVEKIDDILMSFFKNLSLESN